MTVASATRTSKDNAALAAVAALKRDKKALLASLASWLDASSVAAILEVDTDRNRLAGQWFDSCMWAYQVIAERGEIDVFRHMHVEDFDAFVASLATPQGRVGQCWSIHCGIESPTWKQDRKGDVPVLLEGRVQAAQIDWAQTLKQNFAWPHEGELIFAGDVFVERVTDEDERRDVRIDRSIAR